MKNSMECDHKCLIKVLRGEVLETPPIWLMRQAGRYLPEYKQTRLQAGGFLDLVYNPALATEVTLQPIRRYGFDAAILFSDILVVPQAMGQKLWFEEGEGPRLAPPLLNTDLAVLVPDRDLLSPIYQTLSTLRLELPPEVSLIGFAGSPWTIATYMVMGRGSKDHAEARTLAYRDPDRFQTLIDNIIAMTLHYLCAQIEAGAEVVMLFDSWAGVLPPKQFERWVTLPNQVLVAALGQSHPHIPVICFPRGAGENLQAFVETVVPSGIALDERVDLVVALKVIPEHMAIQGNLDQLALVAGGQALADGVQHIKAAMRGRPHIFNLGHGIVPQTPSDHVAQLVQLVKGTR